MVEARQASARGSWPTTGLSFGGDYNPEQWPEDVWVEDMALMREAQVNLVTLGVFAWCRCEPRDGQFDFGWLDRMLDLLHANGIRVDLATPTAAVPMWLHRLHPEILPWDELGHPLAPGGRLGWCPSSPVYREYSLRIVEELARHVAGHPAVAMWHVGNELGGGNARCYCPVSADAFRHWVADRYGTIENVNRVWGMTFWGNSYSSFEEIVTPGGRTAHNPGHLLDFERFSSEALLGQYRAEAAVLRRLTPGLPVTTNFMVGFGPDVVDYARWAPEMDIVANDHYTYGPDPLRHQDIAFSGDRMRGISDGGPWMLMEHATSAASWHPINLAKRPGELIRHAMAHLARGSDSVLYFQWRASKSGTEQFHSAMVPHAGSDSQVFRDITRLGEHLRRLAEIRGTTVSGVRVALLHDNEAGWALRSGLKPVRDHSYAATARAIHSALFDRAVTVDVLPAWADLTGYALVVVPGLFLVADADAQRIAGYAEAGGTVLVTWFSGIVDEHNTVRTGGYPGAFRDLLGVRGEEFQPLPEGATVGLDTGWRAGRWTELLRVTGAEVVARYADGDLAGVPAVTRRTTSGGGAGWYLATDLDERGLTELVGRLLDETGVGPVTVVAPGIEAVRRSSGTRSYLFLLNHGDTEGHASATGMDLLTGTRHDGQVALPAGGVAVIRED
ncbi:beta-galactosidase [Micromonospora sp. KC723]|uniref:beta-galactosidase n=1 Tax=Micromonospora sp. KC723 TaxID=2530381 RepID=UPI00105368EC|nr:beta-galactosidase [Micromonospora sp. KC723]TDB77943.1 beta-galactosidase [Micromonospora sp. KC723]